MSNRITDVVKVVGKGRVHVHGSFAVNNTSDPVASTIKGTQIKSIKHTATGHYTVTIDSKYYDLVSQNVQLQLNSPGVYSAQLQSYSLANGTFELFTNLVSSQAAADIAAHANNRLSFDFMMKNSSAGK